MFKKETVFIVGAGASSECGLPTGNQLKSTIAGGVRFRFEAGEGDPALLDIVRTRHSGFDTQAGFELASTISTFPSIDEALHWWKARQEIVELGKIAIAYYILDAERRSILARKHGVINLATASGTWLSSFVSMALSALERDEADKAFEQVTIINFNYDRTIEHYLYWALQQLAAVPPDKAAECVARLKIIRPYGSIGKLEWQGQAGVSFGGNNHLQEASAVIANIRTFTEQIREPDLLSSIGGALDTASLVIFLGFGFHQQNMELLKPLIPNTNRPRVGMVIATSKGIDEKNNTAIQFRFEQLGLGGRHMLVQCTAAELMDQLRPTISMAVA